MSIPEGAVDVFGDGLGFVRLVQHCGSELDIANAARVSVHKESTCTQKSYAMRTRASFDSF